VFWLMLAPGTTVLGVAVVPVRYDAYGVAHGCLLPLVLLGVAMVATAFATLPSWMRWLLVLSRGVDFAWGVLLQLVVEGYAFALAPPRTPGGYPVVIDPWGFERRVLLNFLERSVWNISYWGDRFVMMRDGLRILCGAVGATMTGLRGWAAMRTSRRPATDERRNWATAMTKPRQPLRKFPAARVS
jgi:hypothetical protein